MRGGGEGGKKGGKEGGKTRGKGGVRDCVWEGWRGKGRKKEKQGEKEKD